MSLVVCRIVAALSLILFPSAGASAAGLSMEAVTVWTEPAVPLVSASNHVATQTLILENGSSKPVPVKLVPEPSGKFQLKPAEGDPVVRLQDGTIIANVPPMAILRIPAELSGLSPPGPYRAFLDVRVGDKSGGRLVIEALDAGWVPPLSVRQSAGIMVKGGLLFRPDGPHHRIFSFELTNPPAAPTRNIALEFAVPLNGMAGRIDATIQPSTFTLAPGHTQPVTVEMPLQSLGSRYDGLLQIKDTDEKLPKQTMSIAVAPNYDQRWNILGVFLLVGMGALLSLAINTWLPVVRRKAEIMRRIASLDGSTAPDSSRRGPAALKLDVERNRLSLAIQNVAWYAMNATPQLDQVETEVADLEKKSACFDRLTPLRTRIVRLDDLPPSTIPQLTHLISRCEDAILRSNLVLAETVCTDAEALAGAIDDTDRMKASLKTEITRLLERVNNSQGSLIDDPFIEKLVTIDLPAALVAMERDVQIDRSHLIDFDQSCFQAHLYVMRYKSELLLRYPELGTNGFRDDLLKAIRAGDRGLGRARDLLDAAEDGVTNKEIDEAVTKGLGRIVCAPTKPKAGTTARFEFRFDDDRLNRSPLAAQRDYEWSFGDGTSNALGRICVHFFRKPTQPVQSLRSWPLLKPFLPPPEPDKPLTVECRIARGSVKLYKSAIDIEVLENSNVERRIRTIDGMATMISVAVALLLAVLLHYTGLERLDTLNDLATPFLAGFGLDQVKDKLVRFPDLVKTVRA